MSSHWNNKVVIIAGGSMGLGRAIATAFAEQGAKIVLAARNEDRLAHAANDLRTLAVDVLAVPTDILDTSQVERLFAKVVEHFGQIDVLVNAVGKSLRGKAIDSDAKEFREALEINFLGLVNCTHAALPYLKTQKGVIVNIASLAGKSAALHMGAYPASKFPVVAYSQQLRLELDDVHTLLVCPGPIRRDDAGERYGTMTQGMPDSAARPGGGVHLSMIDPEWLARRIVKACERRKAELVVPAKARLLFAITQLSPSLGDWLLRRMSR
ncbi:MAG TPA: SDR family NAD(P)-dependent oxidoreductase [Pirellulales bacterium]|nr:SDR family NAD(P)-dependent oxidoreductase [Pirellulales bacterium]